MAQYPVEETAVAPLPPLELGEREPPPARPPQEPNQSPTRRAPRQRGRHVDRDLRPDARRRRHHQRHRLPPVPKVAQRTTAAVERNVGVADGQRVLVGHHSHQVRPDREPALREHGHRVVFLLRQLLLLLLPLRLLRVVAHVRLEVQTVWGTVDVLRPPVAVLQKTPTVLPRPPRARTSEATPIASRAARSRGPEQERGRPGTNRPRAHQYSPQEEQGGFHVGVRVSPAPLV